jgi:hypothetical protein
VKMVDEVLRVKSLAAVVQPCAVAGGQIESGWDSPD